MLLHPSHRFGLRRVSIMILVLLRGLAGYGPLHTLLETVAVVFAVRIFAVDWSAHRHGSAGSFLLLCCAFIGVALAHWLFLFQPERVPRTFIPGQDLTDFKAPSE